MSRTLPPDAADPRIVLWTYAAVVGPAALWLTLFGDVWFREWVPVDLMTRVMSLARVLGTMGVGAAVTAVGLSRIRDRWDRRRALGWLVAAHVPVLVMSWMQVHAIWDYQQVQGAFVLVILATAWLFVGWLRGAGDRHASDAGGPGTSRDVDALRSEYERQIRQAGAQEERNRLARDLHDSVKQQLFAIHTLAATTETRLDTAPEAARESIREIRQTTRDASAEMDAMLDQLRATVLDNNSLVDALTRQCEATRLRTGADVTCDVGVLPSAESFPPGLHAALLRCAQEALANAARHARAGHIGVSLGVQGRRITLTVKDVGAGFDASEPRDGSGLEHIRSRAREFDGEAHISSAIGAGTTVFVTVPLALYEPRTYRRRAVAAFAMCTFLAYLAIRSEHRLSVVIASILLIIMLIDWIRYASAYRQTRRLTEPHA